jgi:DNA-binding NarL/FixJ family response regulator
MDLVDKGLTNKEVASTAGIPMEMASKILNEMFSKAAVKSKTELVKWWRNQTYPLE